MTARLFVSYARDDAVFAGELIKHLATLEREGLIEVWYDQRMTVGQDFDREITRALAAADVILLLVSASFLASDYVHTVELPPARDRHERREAAVVPVIVSACDWRPTWIGRLNAVPRGDGGIAACSNRDEAYQEIVKSLRELIRRLPERRQAEAPGMGVPTVRIGPRPGSSAPSSAAASGSAPVRDEDGAAAFAREASADTAATAPGLGRSSADRRQARRASGADRWLRLFTYGIAVFAAVVGLIALWRFLSEPAAPRPVAAPFDTPTSSAVPGAQWAADLPPPPELPRATRPAKPDTRNIEVPDGVMVIAEVRIADSGGSPWDANGTGLSRLPDLFLCFHLGNEGREFCRPTLGGLSSSRTIAHENVSHVADTFESLTSWTGSFSVALKNQQFVSASVVASGECRFGLPCRLGVDGSGVPVAELLVLPALNSNPDLRARYLQPCVPADSLLLQQAQALLNAATFEQAGKGRLSYSTLAALYAATQRDELTSTMVDAVFAAGDGPLQSLPLAQTFRGSLFERVAALGTGGEWGRLDRAEIAAALAQLRRNLKVVGMADPGRQGCG